MKKMVLVIILAALCSLPALAAQDTVRIFLWDNDAGETAQQSPAAVMDDSYNARYVWADSRDGNLNIYGRIWQRKIEPATGSFLVNRVRVDERQQDQPDVAGTVKDFFFVVWQDTLLKGGEPTQPYVRKFDGLGKPMTDEIRVTEKPEGNAKYPKIAVNRRTQDFVVVWQDNRGGAFDVWGRLFDYRCNPKSPDIKLNDDGLKVPHVLPAVSFTDAGIAVVWQDNRDGASQSDIYCRYFKPDLSPMTAGKRVNSDMERFHITPSVAASDTGYFTVVWLSFQNHLYGDVYAQRFYPDGSFNQTNLKVNLSTDPVICRIPTVTMGADNASFWTSWADSSSSAYLYQIRARYFDRYGRFNPAVKVTNDNWYYGQRAPDVCRFGNYFSVAWLDSSRVNGRGDIFGQYYLLNQDKDDTLDALGKNYNITADKSSGRAIWYHPKKDYDNPYTPWNEDPIAEPDSIYVPLDSAYVLALKERNIPNQNFFQITNTDTLEYAWRKQGKLNSKETYDVCFMDLGYAEDGSTAGVIQPEQLDSLVAFATDTLKCLIVAGNDFGEMYNSTTLFSLFGSAYKDPGNPAEAGNMYKIEGIAGTFTEGMVFDYPYKQGPDNSVDVVEPYMTGSQLIMGSEGAKDKWSRGRATTYGDYYKGEKASLHRNVYLTFSIGSLMNGRHPSTASELTRRILAYQGYNVEPEPIVDLIDSVTTNEGAVELSWTAVSDDALTEKASKYWLKYTKYSSSAGDLGKMSSEVDFIDTGSTYYQTWSPLTPKSLEKKLVYGFAPGDTLIFALKAGDESVPIRWGTLGNQPRIVVAGDTVTPHIIRLGYTFGAVNDFCKSELINTRIGAVGSRDTLYTTWDASNLYLGYCRNDWRTAGDMLVYFDTRTGGADSSFKYNGTGAAGFDINFRPDFCLVFENADSISLKKWNGTSWVDSVNIPTFLAANRPFLDSINKYTYAEIRVPFAYLKYTVGNVFKYLVVCQYEASDNPWNAFPITNSITVKGTKVPAKYGAYYQINSLTSNLSPRNVASPHAVNLSLFTAAYQQGAVNLLWRSELEDDHKLWLVERSGTEEGGYVRLAEVAGTGSGSSYGYADWSALPASEYYYRLGAQDGTGAAEWYGPIQVSTPGLTEIHSYSLQASPNPFGGTCQIRYSLGQPGRASLKVYDICGHLVKTVFDDALQPGSYSDRWVGDDERGRSMPNGIYFYRLTSPQGCLTQKIILLR